MYFFVCTRSAHAPSTPLRREIHRELAEAQKRSGFVRDAVTQCSQGRTLCLYPDSTSPRFVGSPAVVAPRHKARKNQGKTSRPSAPFSIEVGTQVRIRNDFSGVMAGLLQ
jgi:hypothetical protein